ncbi:MAG: tetratricopeptide repeat-containing serine/threonine-protein kinase [Acidobacteria bacterium]|nr:tetratricopeptide repeat-containing serine/threonine-protein kinase [Acidobacteriota bacterium]
MTPDTISHYRILSKLGAGGMGEVYLAEDLNLGRRVALKLLPAKFTQDPERVRRFEQEARAASATSHPNILTIYEIGQVETETGAMHFMAMEFVEGQTLRQRLKRRLGMEEAIEIAIQIGSGLAAAHGAGITHRDIKPENIMIRHDGYVKMLDFGLAKLTESAFISGDDPADTHAETIGSPRADLYATTPLTARPETSPGVILGTVSYMSPEQARGLKVDTRTDIFSFGIVFYEMIAGRAPFEGKTTADMMVSILDRQPAPVSRYATNAPEELEWIISRALAKDRDERYQIVKTLLTDLKRLQKRMLFDAGSEDTAELSLDEVVAAQERRHSSKDSGKTTSGSGTTRLSSGSQRAALDSLAVLPFFTTSGDPNAAYLAEGIPESLILNLSRLSELRVMAWSTVARFRGREVDALEIGRELGVRAIFAGRMYQFADDLVIKTELVDVGDGSQIWGGQYRRKLDDLFTIEQELSREICEHLRLRLNEEERERLAKHYTENAAAYQAYLKGRYHWNQRTAKAIRKAIESFEEAIKLDDDYALAYAGLADCYCLASIYGAAPPRAVMPRAKAAARMALDLDDGLAEAHTSLAAALVWFDWDWEASEREFKRAIELNPHYAVAHHWYGSVLLAAQGRFDEALASERRALDLEPLSLVINSNLGFICYQAGRFDEAMQHLIRTLEMDDNFVYARFHLGLCHAHLGSYDEAIAELERAMEQAGGRGALIQAALGYVSGVAGRRDEAMRILAQLQTFPMNRDVSPFYLAMIHSGLGDKDQALKWLESAYEERYNWLVWLRTEQMFESLRGEEMFIDLARRIGLDKG